MSWHVKCHACVCVELLARQVGAALGDAMSQNVLERVLGRLLWCAGLLKKQPVDRWAAASAAALESEPWNAWDHIQSFKC